MKLRSLLALVTLWALSGAFTLEAKGHRDWKHSMARLHAGDRVRVSLQSGPVDATFVSFSADNLIADSGAMPRDAVLKVERFQNTKSWGRGTHALIGSLIGAGAGAGLGALLNHFSNTNCQPNGFLVPCGGTFFPTGKVAAVTATGGAVVGAGIGAFIPKGKEKHHLIYSAE